MKTTIARIGTYAWTMAPLAVAALAMAAAAGAEARKPTSRPAEKASTTRPTDPFARWQADMKRFEAADKTDPPPQGAALFVGSSSIRGWNTRKYFPDFATINRGFGGSQMADSVHFAERIVLPCRPRVVVLYAGDNDIAAGKPPQRVLADYQAFVKKVHDPLPKTPIVYIAIKPSLARWKLVDKMRQANDLIRAEAEKDKRLIYVDVDKPMLGEDGRPRKELFQKDGLHLSPAGYELWTSLVMPHVKAD